MQVRAFERYIPFIPNPNQWSSDNVDIVVRNGYNVLEQVNPYNHRVLFVGQRQTVQTQIRRRKGGV